MRSLRIEICIEDKNNVHSFIPVGETFVRINIARNDLKTPRYE